MIHEIIPRVCMIQFDDLTAITCLIVIFGFRPFFSVVFIYLPFLVLHHSCKDYLL